ncbi:MAG: hypothetical protein H6867_06685 [Rhodospirillales bacterium]|nr:hypothetical protein [Rhodospirillales bacterium]MCB9995235.1 hypothetical protein [Rhodospirillales bacterium]
MTDRKAESENSDPNVRFIDPPNILRQKVGIGGIEPMRVQRAEDFIDDNQLDFGPYALDLMARLDKIVADSKKGTIKGDKAIDDMTKPIMELKANGGMFKYMLVSEIADIVLNFLENISELNDDVYEIIDAHQNTLQVIIGNKLRGSGGREGKALAEALYQACKRFYKKHNIKPRG